MSGIRKHFGAAFVDLNSRKAIGKEELTTLSLEQQNIRIVTLLGQSSHGKSTLLERLVQHKGITTNLDLEDLSIPSDSEIKTEYTTSYKTVSLHHGTPSKNGGAREEYLFYFNDSPGHPDFLPNLWPQLRISDGVLFVLDCTEGLGILGERMLQICLREKVKPIIIINKLDQLMLTMDGEQIYQQLHRIIESVNVIIETYGHEGKKYCVSPIDGNVIFSSIKEGWRFTIEQFAARFASKFSRSEEKFLKKFWGDHFFDGETKKWRKLAKGEPKDRGFVKFILKTITQLQRAISSGKEALYSKMLKTLNLNLTLKESYKKGEELLRIVMKKFLPLENTILDATVLHIPSPKHMQSGSKSTFFSGERDSAGFTAYEECDCEGPFLYCASRFIQRDNDLLLCGRIFSGTVRTGQSIQIHGKEISETTVKAVFVFMGQELHPVDSFPCGNIVAIECTRYVEIGTFCSVIFGESSPMLPGRAFNQPILRISVEPKAQRDLPKLVEGIRRIIQCDVGGSSYQCDEYSSGNIIIHAYGELHLELLVKQISIMEIDVVVSDPMTIYKETVTKTSPCCLAKSPNRFTRIWSVVEPLPEELCQALQNGSIVPDSSRATRRKLLEYDLESPEIRHIWAYGPEECPTNMLVNDSFSVLYFDEAKDPVATAFQWLTTAGVLAEEELYGCRFRIKDAVLHGDAMHRGRGQMIPASRRSFTASMLSASPALMEPVYVVQILCEEQNLGSIYSLLNQRRGTVCAQSDNEVFGLSNLTAYLPVNESFGFSSEIFKATNRESLLFCLFDHWSIVKGDPSDPYSPCGNIIAQIRHRKGLPPDILPLSHFLDRI